MAKNDSSICLFSDRELVYRALMGKCRQLERILERKEEDTNESRALRDEYERTFALTQNYRKENKNEIQKKTRSNRSV